MDNFPRPDNIDIPNREAPVETTPRDSTVMSGDEINFILRTTLLPEHHEDPNVLLFIRHYLDCRDPGQAAKLAGLHPASGKKLRSRPDIHNCITKLTERVLNKYGFDAAEVVEKVKEIAFFDPADLEREDGSFIKHLREMPPEVRRNIKKLKVKNFFETDPNGMKVKAGEILEYEFYDKTKHLELLGREKELFKETKKVEHGLTENMASLLLESKKRGDDAHNKVIDVTPQKQLPAPSETAVALGKIMGPPGDDDNE